MGKSVAGAVLALAILCMTTQACGQFPMGFGFPNIVQTSTTTAWQHDTAEAFDYEDFSMVPIAGLAFPSIHQTSVHVQSMSHTEFSQTTQFAAIGYPYISAGTGPFGGLACGF
jgi:hypothetical protein